MPDEKEPEDLNVEFQDKIEVACKKAIAILTPFCENVRIFVSTSIDGNTLCQNWGHGNWYAHYGQIRCWLLLQEEGERCGGSLMNRSGDDEEDEDEDNTSQQN